MSPVIVAPAEIVSNRVVPPWVNLIGFPLNSSEPIDSMTLLVTEWERDKSESFPNTSFTNSLLVGGLINNEFFPVIIKNYLLFWSFLIATIAPAVTVLFKYNPSK